MNVQGSSHEVAVIQYKLWSGPLKIRASIVQGHIAKVCRSKPLERKPQTKGNSLHAISNTESPPLDLPIQPSSHPSTSQGLEDTYNLFTLHGQTKPMTVSVSLNNTRVIMEVDTGSSLSLINVTT